MLMRKLLVAVGPPLLCLLTCVLFRWLDELTAVTGFIQYLLKGVLLGVCLGLVLPVAGITLKNNGLTGWLFVAAGLTALALTAQYLQTIGLLHWPVLDAIVTVNGQVVLAESTVTGFLLLTATFNGRRKKQV
ncbi:MAG: hypothetical protein LLF96_05535 [Eubacteriales bacterium]|nr:hypothetical protein [Eubacteriales bacterium]